MSGKDRDRLKVLHEVRKRHITQQQAGVELGISPRGVRALLKRMQVGRRPGGGARVAGQALESQIAGLDEVTSSDAISSAPTG